ncbi:MAG TPA: aromatic amino acid lyase [Actinomycetes bacterium]|nr:aromatic amino acid lyase [Actinomycetes bacterium]
MVLRLASRSQITLDFFERVAWQGEPVRIAPTALAGADAARAAFLRLLENPEVTVYGVTSGYGERAAVRLGRQERRQQTWAAAYRAASFGEPLPERVVRGIVLARLANLLEGHAAVSGRLLAAVAELLDRRTLPSVPLQGNGGSGEILALSHLFGPLIESRDIGEKEGLALINGSPCAAALIADAVLATRSRLRLAYAVFALSVEALRAPLDAYDAALEELWGDEYEARALQRLRVLLADAPPGRRPYQAPVSYRILPRVLGQAERVLEAASRTATESLRSVSDNPVYLPPSAGYPDGRVLSTGGYHNAAASAALHDLAVCWADLCQLAERHVEHLVFNATAVSSGTPSDRRELLRLLMMVAVGYAEEARGAAQPLVLPRGGPGQNDVASPAFLAWSRERAAAECCVAVLALLAAGACHWLPATERGLPPQLVQFVAETREHFPPLTEPRAFGGDLANLAEHFRMLVFARPVDRDIADGAAEADEAE